MSVSLFDKKKLEHDHPSPQVTEKLDHIKFHQIYLATDKNRTQNLSDDEHKLQIYVNTAPSLCQNTC